MNEKVKSVIKNVGWIGAGLSALVFLIITLILVIGFSTKDMTEDDILWMVISASINAAYGIIVFFFLRVQGRSYAKEENKELISQYYGTKTKDKKPHKPWKFWLTSAATDVIGKGGTIAATFLFLVKIAIEGTKDYMMLLMAIGTILMSFGLGLLSMNRAYDDYIENQVPIMKQNLEEAKLNKEEIPNE